MRGGLGDFVDGSGDPEPFAPFGLLIETGHDGADCRARLSRSIGLDDRHCLQPNFSVGHQPRSLCAADRFRQTISIDELTTSIVGIDFSNRDKSKNTPRMDCMLCDPMLCDPGDVVELSLEPTNPSD